MSSPDRQPLAHPDAYEDDDDLDLNELDPTTTWRPQALRSSYDYGSNIPLQNIRRFGGRRRRREEEAEDVEALVGGQEDGKSTREASGEGAPFLANGGSGGLKLSGLEDIGPQRGKGIWRFLPFGRGQGAISLPSTSAEEEPEDDHDPAANRTIAVGSKQPAKYPPNAISNAKYNPATFLPRTLWNEFKFFFNLYFLLVALSQIIPALRIGYLSTYIAPLAFVLMITLGKEAWDDVERRRRDREANSEAYKVLRFETRVDGHADDDGGSRKRKIKSISERKRGKRRRVSIDDEDNRLADAEREERDIEGVQLPSTSVTEVVKPSRDLKVGDVIVLGKDQRVPADVVVLKSFSTETAAPPAYDAGSVEEEENETTLVDMQEASTAGKRPDDRTTTQDPSGGGEAFIRTDQLDGETDWKLRLASPLAQILSASEYVRLRLTAGKPDKKVNDFVGNIELLTKQHWSGEHAEGIASSGPLTIDNTAWANTVLASSTTVHAVVVYTGPQTRAALSTSKSRSKSGLLENEINSLTKILCFLTAALSAALVFLQKIETEIPQFEGAHDNSSGTKWYVAFMRFLILFSTIVPISLRVNLDMGKSVYAALIHRDKGIPGTVVRTSTIPEELGRIEYLLTDKTGTLTRNEMELKKVHVGTVGYAGEAMEEVGSYVRQAFAMPGGAEWGSLWTPSVGFGSLGSATRTKREVAARVRDLVLALAVCHNVTPTTEEDEQGKATTAYQASSPDEIAIVQWTEAVGLRVAHRDRRSITLQSTYDGRTVVRVEILHIFPFTSDSKRMGIIARFYRNTNASRDEDGEVVFFQKGADTVMSTIVAANDWLDEETGNMAREGLRTLVVGRKNLTSEAYSAFSSAYAEASLSLSNRDAAVARVVKTHLERDLDLLGITGVEDKLQPNVKPSLELLRNAGIKIWMLTGDKVETARCVAVSSKLVSRGQTIHTIAGLKKKEAALDALGPLQGQETSNAALLIDGQSLALYLTYHKEAFITTAVRLPAVIACRCSPTQKADLALLIRGWTKKRVACIGDGGNDVSMIQAADVGIGIVGKEGKQASLAADFSITQFAHLTKLLVWHGRNSYKRSSKLALFVMHRGLIAAIAQAVFSVASGGEPIALYRDWLLVGYATVYTMAPVFSLVLDRDVDEHIANLYPELYRELTLGKSLSYKTFFAWVGISLYQGIIIQLGAQVLVPGSSWAGAPTGPNMPSPTDRTGVRRMISLSYSTLVVNELMMVACEITTWHPIMIFSLLGTACAYFGSIPFLGGYFDLSYLLELGFWWRFAVLVGVAVGPVWVGKCVGRRVRPSGWRKVRGV